MTSFWPYVWNRLKAVPVGIWAALGIASTLLGLYLRGRRLEAELVHSRLNTAVAKAAAVGAVAQGKAQAHLERADVYAANTALIETQLLHIQEHGATEQKRLNTMPPSQVTAEYLKLLRSKQP